jgi:hypothetical protein
MSLKTYAFFGVLMLLATAGGGAVYLGMKVKTGVPIPPVLHANEKIEPTLLGAVLIDASKCGKNVEPGLFVYFTDGTGVAMAARGISPEVKKALEALPKDHFGIITVPCSGESGDDDDDTKTSTGPQDPCKQAYEITGPRYAPGNQSNFCAHIALRYLAP